VKGSVELAGHAKAFICDWNKIDYRAGLKAAACVCYAADKASYRTIMSQQPAGLR